jgi:uncharacterized protein (DUF2336 family)
MASFFSFLKDLFGGKTAPDDAAYAAQKRRLESGDAAALKALAEDKNTHPEILYYLAKTGDAGLRQAVAVNPATPVQAATLLATDQNQDVRLVLAQRLVALLPDLSPERHSQLYAYAVQALGMLAQDEVFKVRKALTTTLRDYAKAPPPVVSRLARDVEREIAEPILRFCIALADEDMLEILKGHPESWAVQAIAARPKVSEAVSDAVVDTGDVPGTAVLLGNAGARLSPAALQIIVARARNYPEWHKPIALRAELSVDLARELAGFVNRSILDVLKKRSNFDAATRQGIISMVQRRIEYQREGGASETPEEKVERYAKAERLTPDVLLDALSWQELDFVVIALSRLARIPVPTVRTMLTSGAAKPIVALCWKAGLNPRFCVEMQRLGGKLQPRDLLYPKGGRDYPLTPDEIRWQLEFFGVKP